MPTFQQLSLIAVSLLFFSVARGQAPSNDACFSAIELSMGTTITANNSNTLVDGPEPGCGGSGIKDVWYYFIHPGGNVTIQTPLGTNTDTRIAVYDSCGGAPLLCNDDFGGYLSQLIVGCPMMEAGDTCFLQAGGYNAIVGTFTITLTSSEIMGCTDPTALNYNACATFDDGNCENAVVPANDLCENAFELIIDGDSLFANNTLATNTSGNPTCGNSGTNQMLDLWYYFVASGDELDLYTVLGSLTDSRIAVYSACDGGQLFCDDDAGPGYASYLHFGCGDLIPGNTYYVRVGGYGSLVGNFFIRLKTTNSCILGENCNVPFYAQVGENTAPQSNSWYAFTPPQNGQYRITTCNLNTCDTKLWLYDYCNMQNFDETNEATFTYNDDFCGVQAEITPMLAGGDTYYLRVGDNSGSCGTDSIQFLIEYMGPVTGCTDVSACNYNAVAEIAAPCYYNDDPECDGLGPDLEILGNVIYSSLYNTTIDNPDACLVNEGCLQGMGTRQILRFTTHIKNIGNQDYFIGAPSASSDQFEWDQCHNHYHYEGYAEYLLFDQEGNPMPQIGFKNGFCVLDLECSGGGIAKFGCGNMGITAGCGDIYGSGLACQWIDVTDVPAGDYFLVVRTNWDQSPDNAGHYEQRYDNNVAQVCIHFDRDSVGNLINFTKDISMCMPVVDCLEIPFGDNHPDCEGNCPGITKRGDVESDGYLTEDDVHHYVESTISGDVATTFCTDLNNDGTITVTDAVMLEACIHGQEEQGLTPDEIGDCPYDNEIINLTHSTTIGIAATNTAEGYVDIYVLNPDRELKGLEFTVSGFTISDVQPLEIIADWEIEMAFGSNHISAIGHDPTYLPKFTEPTAILRAYVSSITDTIACVETIVDAVNLDNHNTLVFVGECAAFIPQEPEPCTCDLDLDLNVTINDLLIIMGSFGCLEDCPEADLNQDGMIGVDDVQEFMVCYGAPCAP
jgi:hypothetical protein